MEAVGLAAGLIGLISLLDDCRQLISLISAAKSLDRDAEILETKLDVENMLMLRWANSIGLADAENPKGQLVDGGIQKSVTRVLAAIKKMLSEAGPLQSRYGLTEFTDDPFKKEEDKKRLLSIMKSQEDQERQEQEDLEKKKVPSAFQMMMFCKKIENLEISHKNFRNARTAQSLPKLVRWVAWDKDKFNALVSDLSYFVSSLYKLVPVDSALASSISREDLGTFRSIERLKMINEATLNDRPFVANAAEVSIQSICQTRVLNRLWFRWIDDRRENVKDSHKSTFDWSLRMTRETDDWDDLQDWFRRGTGTYWISGKAGSGKSTLMKYLLHNSDASILLNEWSQGGSCIVVDFFFYHLGKPEQKSQEGILRSLLYKILKDKPALIPVTLPNAWHESNMMRHDRNEDITMPSIAEMRNALLLIAKANLTQGKLVLFVDGLDEYDGDFAMAAQFFQTMSMNSNTKIIISSRPLPDLVGVFANSPKMRLEDLTRGDISTYIHDTIGSHPTMNIDPLMRAEIIQDLTDKASGVFLWVILACGSVFKGLSAFDPLEDLKKRIDELPQELEDLFGHMLARVDARYRQQGIKVLSLVFEAGIQQPTSQLPTLGLHFCDSRDLPPASVPLDEEMSLEKIRNICQEVEGRVRSRCCGLLEIQRVGSDHQGLCFCGGKSQHDSIIDSTVTYMHRTVYDFLCTSDIWISKCMELEDKDFTPNSVLSRAWIQMLGIPTRHRRQWQADICFSNALDHVVFAQDLREWPFSKCAMAFSWLQAATRTDPIGHFWDRARKCLFHTPECPKHFSDLSLGLAIATEIGLAAFLKRSLEDTSALSSFLTQRNDGKPSKPCIKAHFQKSRGRDGCQRFHLWNREQYPHSCENGTVLPLLFHATCQPLLSAWKETATRSKTAALPSISAETIQYLLDQQHDVMEQFINPHTGCVTTTRLQISRRLGQRDFEDDTLLASLFNKGGVPSHTPPTSGHHASGSFKSDLDVTFDQSSDKILIENSVSRRKSSKSHSQSRKRSSNENVTRRPKKLKKVDRAF